MIVYLGEKNDDGTYAFDAVRIGGRKYRSFTTADGGCWFFDENGSTLSVGAWKKAWRMAQGEDPNPAMVGWIADQWGDQSKEGEQ